MEKNLEGRGEDCHGGSVSIFAPFKNVGIIIVDEEHDSSYKQEEKLKYHARDAAVVRAKQVEATLLLGSATPSLESFYNTEKGKFRLLNLPERIEGKPLPRVDVVDVRKGKGPALGKIKGCTPKKYRRQKTESPLPQSKGVCQFYPLSGLRPNLQMSELQCDTHVSPPGSLSCVPLL